MLLPMDVQRDSTTGTYFSDERLTMSVLRDPLRSKIDLQSSSSRDTPNFIEPRWVMMPVDKCGTAWMQTALSSWPILRLNGVPRHRSSRNSAERDDSREWPDSRDPIHDSASLITAFIVTHATTTFRNRWTKRRCWDCRCKRDSRAKGSHLQL